MTDMDTVDLMISEIKDYSSKLNINTFQHNGSIEDYLALMESLSNANKNNVYDIDSEEFKQWEEVGRASDELAEIFNNFSYKIDSTHIVTDLNILEKVLKVLKKIYNLSVAFNNFKHKIIVSTQLPKKLSAINETILSVIPSVQQMTSYINFFTGKENVTDPAVIIGAKLKDADTQAINASISVNNDLLLLKNNLMSIDTNLSSIENSIINFKSKLEAFQKKI